MFFGGVECGLYCLVWCLVLFGFFFLLNLLTIQDGGGGGRRTIGIGTGDWKVVNSVGKLERAGECCG